MGGEGGAGVEGDALRARRVFGKDLGSLRNDDSYQCYTYSTAASDTDDPE